MRKRALKKRREELRELLADRREALGELVLGMHVQEVWDDGLLARGAAEVREVEDGLAELDDQAAGSGGKGEPEGETALADREAPTDEGGVERAPKRWRKESGSEKDGPGAVEEPGVDRASAHPEFETAEHTAEHRLPPEPVGESAVVERPETVESDRPGAAEPGPPATTRPEKLAEGDDSGKAPAEESAGQGLRERPESPEPTPASPAQPVASSPTSGTGRPTEAGGPPAPATPRPGPSPLDDLERRLEQGEREARTGVEAARASVAAESGTEIASLLETLKSDRLGLEEALSAASAKLSEADRRAGEASERASRLEAENREAAARWVREQAAEIEADATVAAEIAESRPQAEGTDDGRLRELESEVETLRKQLDEERREKARTVEVAEGRVREIEARAVKAESNLGADAESGPAAAELREAAVGWLRGQIVALRREMEATERKGRKEG